MPSRQARLEAWLARRGPGEIGLADFEGLLTELAPVTESDLRRLLRGSGTALHPFAAGVDQSGFPPLRHSLLALAACYENGTAEDRRVARRIVVTAKDHARLAARNSHTSPEKRAEKAEMATWMLTWLENPLVFPLWASLRAKALGLDGNAS
jgi:hypothetical protein